jgi:carbon monoxide dehydrogenase subunit G
MPDPEQIRSALSGIQSALQADGYDLTVAVTPGKVSVAIEAGPQACAECLVPVSLMTGMIESELAHNDVLVPPGTVEVRYPTAPIEP